LYLATQWLLPGLVSLIAACLLEQLDDTNVADLLQVAQTYNLSQLKTAWN